MTTTTYFNPYLTENRVLSASWANLSLFSFPCFLLLTLKSWRCLQSWLSLWSHSCGDGQAGCVHSCSANPTLLVPAVGELEEQVLLFGCHVLSDSSQSYGLQHSSFLCPSVSLGVCSNSCPLSWWCYQLSHLLPPSSPSALNLSQHQSFSQMSWVFDQVAKFWSFGISPSNEYSGLISFRIDWFDLL